VRCVAVRCCGQSNMDQLLVVLLIVVCVLYTSISYATSVEVTTDGIIQMSIFLAGAAVFFLILRRVHWLYLNGRPVETLPTWLCNGRFASLSMYFQDSMEDLHRSVRRKGTYAHVALQAAEQFSEVHERRWAMDPAIVMLVVAQLLVATIIAYGTAVEVTLDGYAGFLFCSAFGAFVIVLAKRSGWTLYSGRWKSDFLGVEKMLPEGLSGLLAYYIRLALTVMLPVQLLLFPAVWFAAQWELLDPWLIEALRREEAWAMWALAAILVVTTYIPLYRKHGPGVFLLSMVALGAIVVRVPPARVPLDSRRRLRGVTLVRLLLCASRPGGHFRVRVVGRSSVRGCGCSWDMRSPLCAVECRPRHLWAGSV
jgi:hypothetical protein